MRIAVIGSGIAGGAAAWALARRHEVVLYEKDARPGGHSNTVTIDYDGAEIAVDTGFIVYNERTYPNLTALFETLGVVTRPSDMSFALSAGGGRFEWSGQGPGAVFAQRSNLVSPGFLWMLREIVRFNRLAPADRAAGLMAGQRLGDYLAWRRFSGRFVRDYLTPMGAAIWSMSPSGMLGFPAETFVAFCENHCLLTTSAEARPVWRTVAGGSRRYVDRLLAPLAGRIRLATPVVAVERTGPRPIVVDARGGRDAFDEVVVAAHSDQALGLLADPAPAERAVLGAIGYRDNEVVLHRDPALMPRRRAAWASWNAISDADRRSLSVTYWMNRLQSLDPRRPLFVSLNPLAPPREDLVFARFRYAHPQFDRAALAAQRRIGEIQGVRRTWFCGAWCGYGFHEDGLAAGLDVAEALGGAERWRAAPAVEPMAEAAE